MFKKKNKTEQTIKTNADNQALDFFSDLDALTDFTQVETSITAQDNRKQFSEQSLTVDFLNSQDDSLVALELDSKEDEKLFSQDNLDSSFNKVTTSLDHHSIAVDATVVNNDIVAVKGEVVASEENSTATKETSVVTAASKQAQRNAQNGDSIKSNNFGLGGVYALNNRTKVPTTAKSIFPPQRTEMPFVKVDEEREKSFVSGESSKLKEMLTSLAEALAAKEILPASDKGNKNSQQSSEEKRDGYGVVDAAVVEEETANAITNYMRAVPEDVAAIEENFDPFADLDPIYLERVGDEESFASKTTNELSGDNDSESKQIDKPSSTVVTQFYTVSPDALEMEETIGDGETVDFIASVESKCSNTNANNEDSLANIDTEDSITYVDSENTLVAASDEDTFASEKSLSKENLSNTVNSVDDFSSSIREEIVVEETTKTEEEIVTAQDYNYSYDYWADLEPQYEEVVTENIEEDEVLLSNSKDNFLDNKEIVLSDEQDLVTKSSLKTAINSVEKSDLLTSLDQEISFITDFTQTNLVSKNKLVNELDSATLTTLELESTESIEENGDGSNVLESNLDSSNNLTSTATGETLDLLALIQASSDPQTRELLQQLELLPSEERNHFLQVFMQSYKLQQEMQKLTNEIEEIQAENNEISSSYKESANVKSNTVILADYDGLENNEFEINKFVSDEFVSSKFIGAEENAKELSIDLEDVAITPVTEESQYQVLIAEPFKNSNQDVGTTTGKQLVVATNTASTGGQVLESNESLELDDSEPLALPRSSQKQLDENLENSTLDARSDLTPLIGKLGFNLPKQQLTYENLSLVADELKPITEAGEIDFSFLDPTNSTTTQFVDPFSAEQRTKVGSLFTRALADNLEESNFSKITQDSIQDNTAALPLGDTFAKALEVAFTEGREGNKINASIQLDKSVKSGEFPTLAIDNTLAINDNLANPSVDLEEELFATQQSQHDISLRFEQILERSGAIETSYLEDEQTTEVFNDESVNSEQEANKFTNAKVNLALDIEQEPEVETIDLSNIENAAAAAAALASGKFSCVFETERDSDEDSLDKPSLALTSYTPDLLSLYQPQEGLKEEMTAEEAVAALRAVRQATAQELEATRQSEKEEITSAEEKEFLEGISLPETTSTAESKESAINSLEFIANEVKEYPPLSLTAADFEQSLDLAATEEDSSKVDFSLANERVDLSLYSPEVNLALDSSEISLVDNEDSILTPIREPFLESTKTLDKTNDLNEFVETDTAEEVETLVELIKVVPIKEIVEVAAADKVASVDEVIDVYKDVAITEPKEYSYADENKEIASAEGLEEVEVAEPVKGDALATAFTLSEVTTTETAKNDLTNALIGAAAGAFNLANLVSKVQEQAAKPRPSTINLLPSQIFNDDNKQINDYVRFLRQNLERVTHGAQILERKKVNGAHRYEIKLAAKVSAKNFVREFNLKNDSRKLRAKLDGERVYVERYINTNVALIDMVNGKREGDVCIGLDKNNYPFSIKLDQGNSLITGSAAEAKSNFATSLMLNLAFNYAPDEVEFMAYCEDSRHSFLKLSDLPHFVHPVLVKEQAQQLFAVVFAELIRRRRLCAQLNASDYINYNHFHKVNPEHQKKYPPLRPLYIFIDGIGTGMVSHSQFKLNSPNFTLMTLIYLFQQGKRFGMNFIVVNNIKQFPTLSKVCTQRFELTNVESPISKNLKPYEFIYNEEPSAVYSAAQVDEQEITYLANFWQEQVRIGTVESNGRQYDAQTFTEEPFYRFAVLDELIFSGSLRNREIAAFLNYELNGEFYKQMCLDLEAQGTLVKRSERYYINGSYQSYLKTPLANSVILEEYNK